MAVNVIPFEITAEDFEQGKGGSNFYCAAAIALNRQHPIKDGRWSIGIGFASTVKETAGGYVLIDDYSIEEPLTEQILNHMYKRPVNPGVYHVIKTPKFTHKAELLQKIGGR